jgi:hypothetical protein
LVEIDQHYDAGLGPTPASAMKPTAAATQRSNPSHHISQSPPTRANGSESITIIVSVIDLNDLQSHGSFKIFVLAAPDHVIAPSYDKHDSAPLL